MGSLLYWNVVCGAHLWVFIRRRGVRKIKTSHKSVERRETRKNDWMHIKHIYKVWPDVKSAAQGDQRY